MANLLSRIFYGNSKKYFSINGITVVESEFLHYNHCPLHYHENAHFAFTTKGNLIETHRKNQIQLSPGCLIYNHSQEPHCNSNYSSYVSAIHVDIDMQWFKNYDINYSVIEGVVEISNPVLKINFQKILKELKCSDSQSSLEIESLVLQSVNELISATSLENSGKPSWIKKVKEILYDRYMEKISLQEIASVINIHPVYLCQQFPVYFNCSMGEFIRKIKVEKAVELILNKPEYSLTEIAYCCGFSDQSHFIRVFKKNIGVVPLAFRRISERI